MTEAAATQTDRLSFPISAAEIQVLGLREKLARVGFEKVGFEAAASIAEIDVEIIGVGEGFLGQLARVTLRAEGETGDLPCSVVAKFASPDESTRAATPD